MPASKADIIAQLQRDILPLQGFKAIPGNMGVQVSLGQIKKAFPNHEFPLGAVHEFVSTNTENLAAGKSFICSIIAALMKEGSAAVWIGNTKNIFPPALASFGIAPEKIIFITLKKEKEILWTMEEALKCEGLAAVVAEIKELSFTASRRLQLAVEQSRVTGFLLRHNPVSFSTTACVTRWMINPIPSLLRDGMPGVGFPRWKVALLKVRNGKPGSWEVECVAGKLKVITTMAAVHVQPQKKTG